jgi:hypothetical protein
MNFTIPMGSTKPAIIQAKNIFRWIYTTESNYYKMAAVNVVSYDQATKKTVSVKIDVDGDFFYFSSWMVSADIDCFYVTGSRQLQFIFYKTDGKTIKKLS